MKSTFFILFHSSILHYWIIWFVTKNNRKKIHLLLLHQWVFWLQSLFSLFKQMLNATQHNILADPLRLFKSMKALITNGSFEEFAPVCCWKFGHWKFSNCHLIHDFQWFQHHLLDIYSFLIVCYSINHAVNFNLQYSNFGLYIWYKGILFLLKLKLMCGLIFGDQSYYKIVTWN